MIDIKKLIFHAIENQDYLWFPELTEQLVINGWKNINKQYSINKDNYSTEAALNCRISNSISSIANLIPNVNNPTRMLQSIDIHQMPEEIVTMYSYTGTKPYSVEILKNSTVLECLQESLDVLALIPTVYETISLLIASLHVIQIADDDFDVSYSLPNIPFSIFVSVPSKRMNNDILRVAEAILHEAMHLQLTLMEQCVPMIIETNKTYFSPWKNEFRHPRGVLHALYVFAVIKQFFELIRKQKSSHISIKYLDERCDMILSQLKETHDFMYIPYLTEMGQNLTKRFFNIKLLPN